MIVTIAGVRYVDNVECYMYNYEPITISHCLHYNYARLFLDDSLMSDKVRKHLHCGDTGGVQVHPYDALPEHVNLLKCEGTIWVRALYIVLI